MVANNVWKLSVHYLIETLTRSLVLLTNTFSIKFSLQAGVEVGICNGLGIEHWELDREIYRACALCFTQWVIALCKPAAISHLSLWCGFTFSLRTTVTGWTWSRVVSVGTENLITWMEKSRCKRKRPVVINLHNDFSVFQHLKKKLFEFLYFTNQKKLFIGFA